MPTLNQIKQVIQAKFNHIIKELKASSSSVAPRLYTEAAHSFTNTTLMLEAHVSAHVFYKITIKSDSEISEQHL